MPGLPPALSRHPERLSGSCFCIDKYLASGIATALNISEITCTRLHDITSGTRGLKFHATIPISIEGRKLGLINRVSKETQQHTEEQLSVLDTISELISIAVQGPGFRNHMVKRTGYTSGSKKLQESI